MKLADPDNDAGWFGRFTHYDFLITAAAEAALIVAYILGAVWRGVGLAALIGSLLLMLVGMRALRRHTRQPCEKCIGDMPLDAQAQAERKRLSLRLHHWSTSPAWFTLGVGCVASTWLLPDWAGAVVLAGLSACVLATSVAGWRHRPLQLVCPWCKRRGGDGDAVPERTPVPDPAGAKTA